MNDFFISYNSADRKWALWIAGQLKQAGYSVLYHEKDARPGNDFAVWMLKATTESKRTIVVLSRAYLRAEFTQTEWGTAFAQDPTGKKGVLLPVRVEEFELPGIFKTRIYIDLVGRDEREAQTALLQGIDFKPIPPTSTPEFPGTVEFSFIPKARFPGALPPISNVPHSRNQNFTGREQLLNDLHVALTSGKPTALIQAIHGLGGAGKTQLAVEYCFRYAAEYEIVLWINAETPTILAADYAKLINTLNLPDRDNLNQKINIDAVRHWLGQNSAWLLVFDNAENPADLHDYLPQGSTGQVLITSRNQSWRGVARLFAVKEWERQESIDFLCKRTGRDDRTTANLLADALGNLPLALEQAGAYIEAIGCSLADYLELFKRHQLELLKDFKPLDYRDTVATTWEISIQKVRTESALGADIFNLCAFFAPEDMPLDLCRIKTNSLPKSLSELSNALAFNKAVATLLRYSLLKKENEKFSMHRLVQSVARDCLPEEERKAWAEACLHFLSSAFPSNPEEKQSWPHCQRLLLHVLTTIQHGGLLINALGDFLDLLMRAAIFSHRCAAYNGAEWVLRFVLDLNEKISGPETLPTARVLDILAWPLQKQGKLSEAEALLRRSLEISEKQLGPEHPEVASVMEHLGKFLVEQGNYIDSEPLLRQALTINEKHFGSEKPEVGKSLHSLSVLLRKQGKYMEAEPLCRRALTICEKELEPDDEHLAEILRTWANLLLEQGKHAEAVSCFTRSLDIKKKRLGSDHPDFLMSLSDWARLSFAVSGHYDNAVAHYRWILDRQEAWLGPNHLDVGTTLNNLAVFLHLQHKYDEAEALLRRSLEIKQNQLGPEHPDIAISLNNLANLFFDLDKADEAELLLRQALKINEKRLGAQHSDFATILATLAEALRQQGKHAEAEPLYRQALKINENQLGPEHPSGAIVLTNLGFLLSEMGRYSEAELLQRQALEISEKRLGSDHPQVALIVSNMAVIPWKQGNYADAELLIRRAQKMREKCFGADHPEVAKSLTDLAHLLFEQGHFSDVESLCRRALEMIERHLGSDHLEVIFILGILTTSLLLEGKDSEAMSFHRRSLEIQKKWLGPEHLTVATSLTAFALLLQWQGEYVEAELLFRQALKIKELRLGAEHLDIAPILKSLAFLLEKQEKYVVAEQLYRRALEIYEKQSPQDNTAIAAMTDKLGGILMQQGKHEAAESFFRRSLEIRENKESQNHSEILESLLSLAAPLCTQGNFAEAESIMQRIMEIIETQLDASHPMAIKVRAMLMGLQNRQRFQEDGSFDEKMMKVIFELAKPLLDLADNAESRKQIFRLAIAIWNCDVLHDRVDEQLLDEIIHREKTGDPQELKRFLEILIQRKHDLFPNNKGFII